MSSTNLTNFGYKLFNTDCSGFLNQDNSLCLVDIIKFCIQLKTWIWITFVFYRTQVSWGPIYVSQCLSLSEWVSERRLANLTDVTLADQATNSIPTDDASSMPIWQFKCLNMVDFGDPIVNWCIWHSIVDIGQVCNWCHCGQICNQMLEALIGGQTCNQFK